MHQALLYEKGPDGVLHCLLCAHGCRIAPGKTGICRVRANRGGELFSLSYGRLVAASADPIEKKPLYHFLPGSRSFSIATAGCNFRCGFCQNHEISQNGGDEHGPATPPQKVLDAALASGCASLSYTYTEPTIFFEYALDCMRLAHASGLKNVFVSNGYQSEPCLEMCRGLLDAANIDLKAFSDSFYKNECKARLEPVLDTLRRLHAMGVWLEVTTLLIPGKNDDPGELRELAGFIRRELDAEVPWHISAYTPRYQYTAGGPPPTGRAALDLACAIGREAGLKYVYAGNLASHESDLTRCPGCGAALLRRRGFSSRNEGLKGGECAACGARIAGVFA